MNLQGGSAAFLAQQAQTPGRDGNACSRWQVRVADVFTGNSMVTAASSRVATLKRNPEICSNAIKSNTSKKENAMAEQKKVKSFLLLAQPPLLHHGY